MTQAPALSYEVFVVLKQYRCAHVDYRVHALALQSVVDRGMLPEVSLYYRRDTDTALLALAFDPRQVTRAAIGRLLQTARKANVSVLEAGLLPADERQRFYRTYLPLYDVRVIGLRTVDHALTALETELGMGVAAPLALVNARTPYKRLEVRFRRGDQWSLGRLRSLSSNGVFVATGGPPRTGDVIEVEISVDLDEPNAASGSEPKLVAFEPLKVLLHAAVVQVTHPETAVAMGPAGFGARFLLAGNHERDKLANLLAEAQDVVRAAEPPPPRREVRYPVRWPVMLARDGRALRLSALDVSRHGLFVAGNVPIFPDRRIDVSMPLDDRGAPLHAGARVARTIPEETARARRLQSGAGLELAAMSDDDERRFERFIERVAKRARRWVLVGASPERTRHLLAELMAAGYAASGASDPPALVSKAASARAPDLVVLDGTLLRNDARAAHAVERALSVRNVPTVQLADDASAASARERVDRELLSA